MPARAALLPTAADHPGDSAVLRGGGMESLAIDYTVGGGSNRAARQELVIYSWDRAAGPAGLF